MRHKATLAPIIPIFGLWRPCMGVNGAKNKDSDVQWFSYIFFIFLKDLFYKLSLGCNTSHYLVIFLWKLIKNSYSAIKNLKKLWLQAKFSNFWMQLVPIKNIWWFSHNKWDKHLISSKKDLSQVPMFVSHNGIHFNRRLFVNSFGRTIWFSRWFPLGTLERTARLGWKWNPMHTSLRTSTIM